MSTMGGGRVLGMSLYFSHININKDGGVSFLFVDVSLALHSAWHGAEAQ